MSSQEDGVIQILNVMRFQMNLRSNQMERIQLNMEINVLKYCYAYLLLPCCENARSDSTCKLIEGAHSAECGRFAHRWHDLSYDLSALSTFHPTFKYHTKSAIEK